MLLKQSGLLHFIPSLWKAICRPDKKKHTKSNITYNSPTHIVGRHFNLPGHRGITSLETHVLCFVKLNPNNPLSRHVRIKAELQWIHRLRSFVPKGLNLMYSTSYMWGQPLRKNKTTSHIPCEVSLLAHNNWTITNPDPKHGFTISHM